MKLSKIRNKIPETCTATSVIVQHYGYTNKFAKRLVVQDSTDVHAYSNDDRDARIGVRRIPKKQQQNGNEKMEFFF